MSLATLAGARSRNYSPSYAPLTHILLTARWTTRGQAPKLIHTVKGAGANVNTSNGDI
jgi:hypothetical protein